MRKGLILAVETSCDETAVAIVEDGSRILSNIVASQSDIHRRYGGVVPEVASRKHVETITLIMNEALETAGIRRDQLSAVAVTQGPGLVGALIIGIIAAKALALSLDIPLIGVHHIAGHIYANQLIEPLSFPSLALVVSGGHTELIHMKREGVIEKLGQTRDDAAGEAYDKVARALNLPYPGGPHVDQLAQQADGEIKLPRAWLEEGSFDFSFSGIKSAVLNVLNQTEMKGEKLDKAHIAKGFQNAVIDVLVEKSVRAAQINDIHHLMLCGGVAANQGLRTALQQRCEAADIRLRVPPVAYCTDNAAMIGAAAHIKWKRRQFDDLSITADPALSLEKWMNQTEQDCRS